MSTLKLKRGSVKHKLTLFTKYVGELGDRTDLSDLDFLQLNDRLTKSELLLDEFETLQIQIEEAAVDIEVEYSEREKFESDFFTIIALAKGLLKGANERFAPVRAPSEASAVPHQINQSIKLPTIELPNFDGNYLKWMEFRDTYISLIHENESIGDIQKFHYLRASLGGGARQLIQSLEFTAINYQIAWELILDRYNNKKLLIHNHVKSLFELESVHKESARDLRALLDSISKNIEALKQLNQPTDNWDTLIIYIATQKLDILTLREWENFIINKDVPSLKEFKSFLKSRADLLETIGVTQGKVQNRESTKAVRGFLTTEVSGASRKCAICKGSHYIQNCAEFLKLPINERCERIKALRLCLNCLRMGHAYKACRGSTCKKCSLKHHTLIHFERARVDANQGENSENNVALSSQMGNSYILLATALVQLSDERGNVRTVRALLDSGSQASYITKNLCDNMNLKTAPNCITVMGLNSCESTINRECSVKIQGIHNNFEADLKCFVISKITESLPSVSVDPSKLNIPKHIKLADPSFFKSDKIDLLLGAQIFWRLMCIGQIDLGRDKPLLQKTRLGWVLSGPVHKNYSKTLCNFTQVGLQKDLAKFWEIEEVPSYRVLAKEDRECEAHFSKYATREKDGRFVVTLPLSDSVNKLGDSYASAKNRFLSLEKRLENKPEIRLEYRNFINEYKELGHMSKVTDLKPRDTAYYMPHHCVLKESLTTKLRVVFDASAPSTTGYSLNNLQMCGPTLQNTLFSILLRFRQHSYVIAADVEKMYRQIKINPEQTCLQRILWRDNPNNPIDIFELNTLTYGTTAASYLAIRCLFELAHECKSKGPQISQIITNDFYVDDMLTGANSVEEAASLAKGVHDVLIKGCFKLRKFYSNNANVLKYVKGEGDSSVKILEFDGNENTKTLGLMWCPVNDQLKYKINKGQENKKLSKRTILSGISQVFDPLGLISPVIINIKILLQQLWLEKLTWDEGLPLHIAEQWVNFRKELDILNQLIIKRLVLCRNRKDIQIHGFCDASEKAYGGAVFVRSVDENNCAHVHLLCAKSKVAPLKTITLPRLELSGALILARLVKSVVDSLTVEINDCTLWTDSTIVLGWLKTSPNKLKSFVGNRVSEIQDLTCNYKWRHVPSKDNPADLVSRGVTPNDIVKLDLWWHGPDWLKTEAASWPKVQASKHVQSELPDTKNTIQSFASQTQINFPFDRFSKLETLKRVTAWILRFKYNARARVAGEASRGGKLSIEEINDAWKQLIRIAQANSFSGEIHKLSNSKSIHYKSRILSLNPFLDSEGLLRVGGRLENSNWSSDKKHPILLCSKHLLSILIFREEHLRLLHCGPQQLLASVRERFWPVLGRNLAKNTVRGCVRCFKAKPTTAQPIMGQLPAARLQPGPPFSITGVDYAGPLLIKDKRGRGGKIVKGYVGLFVCFATKAVHLELISDLTKDCFLMALRRFVSRRGIPSKILSDNGKNFVAARSELNKFKNFLSENESDVIDFAKSNSIEWKFIPPYSPHFGGLWEAGIKSTKRHLRAVMGNAYLTFEELNTLLVQVEAILNSRPLTPLSNDPNDLVPLTPSHFLIGRPLVAVPDRDLTGVPTNRLLRYQHVQQCQQHFWKRWHLEYINEMQQRTKWKTNKSELVEGALVLIKDNQPPLRWNLGRIVKVLSGCDGKGRVAVIKTMYGETTRAFSKLCPLPLAGILDS